MKPPARWPLHPRPLNGETLSSWLRRIAACYQMSLPELLEFGTGHDPVAEHVLELAPPSWLLEILAQRTGIDADQIRQMCLKAVLERAVQGARDHPAEAQALYNFLVIGCRTPESVQHLLATFRALGIPTDALSYNNDVTALSVTYNR